MEITILRESGRVPVTVLRIRGEVALDGRGLLGERAKEAYDAGARDMLLDLTDVTFLSSSGLRTIHQVFDLLRADSAAESSAAVKKGLRNGTFKSRHLKLLCPARDVRRTLETAGYDMFLEIYTDLHEAIASF
jgi:anti-anti-sigma regulatory factor